ncbi:hypothetical protein UVI_02015750 [Ustilaginoidea virens]|uniref:Uncharacterized protein n=1 Tax=Ustilaginoidea virens TaxID=1159556 RepID=A0A1B5KSV6_USTVR|nr:hypothetical protein UVI_02015750 [Ustilaginoidea virens]
MSTAEGREVKGIGGGASSESCVGVLEGVLGRPTWTAGGSLVNRPLSKPLMVPSGSFRGAVCAVPVCGDTCADADAGIGDGSDGADGADGAGGGFGDLAGLEGSLGGRLGRAAGAGGDKVPLLTLRPALNFAACLALISLPRTSLAAASCAATSLALASSSRFVGGKAGRLSGSQVAGAINFLGRLPPAQLVLDDVVRVREAVDTVEFWETSDDAELRLAERYVVGGWADVRRGSAGGVSVAAEFVLAGRGGGPGLSGVDVSLPSMDI